MILKLLIISITVFVLSLLIYILTVKKSRKGAFLRKASGLISLAGLISGIVFAVIFIKANNIKIFDTVKSYDLNKVYTETLTKKGAEEAYQFLPVSAHSQGGISYFVNSKGDAFSMIKTEDGVYQSQTVADKIAYMDDSKTLKATITTDGELILDGYLFYSVYDEQLIEFKEKTVAQNVEFCDFTANSLFYITKDGDLYAMGFNEYGQLGDATTKNKSKPEFIKSGIMKASVSDTHALIIDKFGTLYAVGDNSYSQLGNKTAVSSTELTKIMQGVKDVKAGNYFSLVLTVNGELYTAGKNDFGQLGNSGEEFKAELIQALSGVEKIETNGNTCAALTYSGELYVWGDNTDCKAGCSQGEIIGKPFKVNENVYDFALSDKGVIVITADRDVLISNEQGALEVSVTLGAQIPEIYKDKFSDKFNISDQKV